MNVPGPMALHRWIGQRVQRKLVLATGGFLAAISVGLLLLITVLYQNRLIEENTRASMQVNRLFQATLENAMLKRDLPGLKQILHALAGQEDIKSVMILNPELTVRFSSDPTRLDETLKTPLARAALTAQVPQAEFLSIADGAEVLRSINPVHNQPACHECHGDIEKHPVNGLLVVDYDAGVIRRDARASAFKLAVLGAGLILVVGAGIWALLWWIVIRPLKIMSRATTALAKGHLDTRITPRGDDELAQLGHDFNAMSQSLENSHEKLRHSETYLQALIDAIPDGVRVIDDEYRIIKANKSYCAMTGQTMDQVLAAPCFRSSHHRESACPFTLVYCPVHELRSASFTGQIVYRDSCKRADGSDVFVEISAAPVEVERGGRSYRCVVESIRDLGEQAQISQQQRLSEIGLLAAGVAHEINNPLSSIDLGINALQSDLAVGQTHGLDERFDLIGAEIQNCIKITGSLLLLSAPPGNAEDLVVVADTVTEVLALLRFEAEQHEVEIVHEIPKDLRVLASDSDVRMLVINLALNAIHAMPQGGVLRVDARREDGRIVLDVSDTGVGLSADDLDQIFLPFWSRRADNSTGRGLGLSIVKSILQRNDAEISVHSDRGKGSRFSVRLNDADKEV